VNYRPKDLVILTSWSLEFINSMLSWTSTSF